MVGLNFGKTKHATLLFQVGKVVLYDPISLRIILFPVQEYPITTEENEDKDEPDMLVDLSPYKEDGSLEVISILYFLALLPASLTWNASCLISSADRVLFTS